jgi:toxin YoeB
MTDIRFEPQAWDDYLWWQTRDRQMLKRINALLRDIGRAADGGIGKAEPLKGNLSGYWSRRIDSANRLVYRVAEGRTEVIQCRGHYQDD